MKENLTKAINDNHSLSPGTESRAFKGTPIFYTNILLMNSQQNLTCKMA